jgi:ribosomal protein S16
MAVRIRLQRRGTHKRPFYHIVVADRRAPRDGSFIERLGTYDPLKEPAEITLKTDRYEEWVEKGALPSEAVVDLVRRFRRSKQVESQPWCPQKETDKARVADRSRKRVGWPGENPAPSRKRSDQAMMAPGSTDNMKDLIEYIAKALVDQPDQVKVSEVEGEKTSVIELTVAKEDLGKVIGKQGRTARAIRTILSAASTKIRKRSVLEIIE